jgi:hypothetical protein
MMTVIPSYRHASSEGLNDDERITSKRCQLNGLGTKSNINDWSAYAKENSFDPSESKAKSKRDLSDAGATRDVNLGDVEGFPQQQGGSEDARGWRHFSEVSRTNSYTGKGGSKRD